MIFENGIYSCHIRRSRFRALTSDTVKIFLPTNHLSFHAPKLRDWIMTSKVR